MMNLSPPCESGMRALKETPLRALKVNPNSLSKTIIATWFRPESQILYPLLSFFNFALMPLLQDALFYQSLTGNLGNVVAGIPFKFSLPHSFEEALFVGSGGIVINSDMPPIDGSGFKIGPNQITCTSSINTAFGVPLEPLFDTYFPAAFLYNAENPNFSILYNTAIRGGGASILVAMSSNIGIAVQNITLNSTTADTSDANGKIYFVSAVDGSETLITDYDWQTGFSALSGARYGTINFSTPAGGGRLRVTFNSLNFRHGAGAPVAIDNSLFIMAN